MTFKNLHTIYPVLRGRARDLGFQKGVSQIAEVRRADTWEPNVCHAVRVSLSDIERLVLAVFLV